MIRLLYSCLISLTEVKALRSKNNVLVDFACSCLVGGREARERAWSTSSSQMQGRLQIKDLISWCWETA